MKSIAVVGGGSAGLVAALILKTHFPHMYVDVIRSSSIGIIGVGEGSTEHWTVFTDFIGIKYQEVIRECDATFKSGIMFKDWGPNDYLQSIGSGFTNREKNYPFVYGHQIAQGVHPSQLVSPHAWDSRVNTWFIGKDDSSPTMQFHFNTHKLNEFLTRKAQERGIRFFDDEIVDVALTDDGNIGILTGKNSTYDYDFYIDSTGFKKLLIDKLGAKWRSHGEYLKMKSAITFATDQETNIPMWTTAQAMDAGWMFSIPTYGRTGNGYIFDSNYITVEEAKAEVEQFLGHSVEFGKQINFDPGALDRPWIKNCCAIGLSASFVEPLEASSIGTSIQQSFLLAETLINYNDHVVEKYNNLMTGIIDNIRDFIVLHYITPRTDTPFWRDVATTKLPPSLQAKLDVWRHKLPTANDFIDSSDYKLFSAYHHILVLHGLGLFDIDSIRNEYMHTASQATRQNALGTLDQIINMQCQTIPHTTFVEVIRNTTNENY